MGKLIFFDIDGTLVSEDGYFPESAKKALSMAKANGHSLFISTGRTFSNVDMFLQELGFDGYLCGCGTEIIYKGKSLMHHTLSKDVCCEMAMLVRECNVSPIYERSDMMFYDPKVRIIPFLDDMLKLYEKKKAKVIPWEEVKEAFWFDKFVIWYDENSDIDKFYKRIKPYFYYIDRGTGFIELVPNGYSKGKAILNLIDYLNADVKDTIAIGDSLNDLQMMEVVHTSIAMGDGEKLHPYVSYVTKKLKDDGLFHALNHFNII